jgi:hypothetical protein
MDVNRRGRLIWYVHVMRKQDEEWVKKCISMEVAGKRETKTHMYGWIQ